jgi:hypothetical protein
MQESPSIKERPPRQNRAEEDLPHQPRGGHTETPAIEGAAAGG